MTGKDGYDGNGYGIWRWEMLQIAPDEISNCIDSG